MRTLGPLAVALLLAGCAGLPGLSPPPAAPGPPPAPAPTPAPAPAPDAVAPRVPASPAPAPPESAPAAPAASPQPAAVPARPAPAAAPPRAAAPRRRVVPLAAPVAARNWDEFKLQAARRLVQAHPDGSYTGKVPEPLLAIPVIEVEFNADGSVRRVQVLRQPRQAQDTVQLAIDAIHRAAPYGAMSRLPLPWKWAAVFLFDDERRFKPRELDD